MLVMGWGRATPRDIGAVAPTKCPHCHNQVVVRFFRVTSWFRLFWVPLVPYRRQEFLICPICRTRFGVSAGQREAVQQMIARTAQRDRGALPESDYSATVRDFWALLGGGAPQVAVSPAPQVAVSPAPQVAVNPARWAVDPTQRNEERFWDGTGWSPMVRNSGVEALDPIG
jgi:hypothetical protein